MTPEIEQIKKEISAEMEEWAAVFVKQRVDFLRKRKIEASGQLINSIAASINQQARREAVELLLAFDDTGRFLDMKRLRPSGGGADYITALENWIREKGFEGKFTQKFMQKYRLQKAPPNVLNKIAWGIAMSRSTGKFRKKKWYNKPKTAAIGELFTNVAAMIPDIVSKQIAQNLGRPI
mgnify:CR=1 FL=1